MSTKDFMTDPQTEEFTVDLSKGEAEIVRMLIRQLEKCRKSTPQPSELEWEIRLYEYILSQPDPDETARQYMNARDKLGTGRMLPKRDVVVALGWDVK